MPYLILAGPCLQRFFGGSPRLKAGGATLRGSLSARPCGLIPLRIASPVQVAKAIKDLRYWGLLLRLNKISFESY